MAEGNYTSYYKPIYQGGYLPSNNIKFYSLNGVRFMLLAIVFYLFSYVFRAASIYSQSNIFTEMTQAQYDTAMALGWLSIIFVGIFIIMTLISLYMFYLGRYEFNTQHTKNVKWSIIFMIGFLIVSLLSIIISVIYVISSTSSSTSDLTSSVYYIYSGFPQAFYILQSFFLGFMILLSVKEFVSLRLMLFLYIVAGLIIFISLIDTMIDILDPYIFNPETAQDFAEIIRFKAYFIFAIAITWGLAAFSYIFILIKLKTYGRALPQKSPVYQPILRTIIKYIRPITSKPYNSFIIILIIAVIMGVAAAESAQEPRRLGIVTGLPIIDVEPSIYAGEHNERGTLNEGESIDIEVEIDCEVFYFNFKLFWEDEQDEPLRDNEPDKFTMAASIGRLSKSVSNENENDDSGVIIIVWDFGRSDVYYVGTAIVTITLDYAGDQEGPVGIGGSPLIIEDNSNDYEITLKWGYFQDV